MVDEARVAIVTGSATGIGAAVAQRLASHGWHVVINYTKSEAEARTTAETCRAQGGAAETCQANVAEDGDCRRLAQCALDHWGRIDALVNNAGTTKFVAADDLEGLSRADFEQIFAVNLVGAFQMTRAAVPALRATGAGSVVNLSSHSGLSGQGSSVAYAASKGALNTLTTGLARSLAPDIRVNAVCPGFVETRWVTDRMSAADFAAFKARAERNAPLGQMPRPDDVAEAVSWFVEGGRLVTGQLLVIDAGMHLGIGTPRPPRDG